MNPKTNYAYYLVNLPNEVIYLSGEKQARPYTLYCKLRNWRSRQLRFDAVGRVQPSLEGWTFMSKSGQVSGSMITGVNNSAYKRMVDELGDASSLGATLTAERRETWGLVVNVITRALMAARQVRRLDLGSAARTLGLPYFERTVVKRRRITLPNGRKRFYRIKQKQFRWREGRWYAKELGSGWLMYSYGVKPLMQDIYNGMDLLQREFPYYRIRGGAKGTSVVYDKWNQPGTFTAWYAEYACRQSVEVAVSNPNLWLCNRLGLINPIQWLNEAIPLSFVADWFSNLSDVISSMTDFVGLETRNPCVNWQQTVTERVSNHWSDHDWVESERICVEQGRNLDLILPKLRFAYERFQWQRGANAISLLLQLLRAK